MKSATKTILFLPPRTSLPFSDKIIDEPAICTTQDAIPMISHRMMVVEPAPRPLPLRLAICFIFLSPLTPCDDHKKSARSNAWRTTATPCFRCTRPKALYRQRTKWSSRQPTRRYQPGRSRGITMRLSPLGATRCTKQRNLYPGCHIDRVSHQDCL